MRSKIFETSFFVGQPLKVLVVEQSPATAITYFKSLKGHGYKVNGDFVSLSEDFIKCLSKSIYDVIISGFILSGWTGLDVLEVLVKLQPRIPSIIVADNLNDDEAGRIIDMGAKDYVLKDQLRRLPLTVRRLMREQRLFREIINAGEEREQLIIKLQETLAEVKRLSGLLPVCITCKRVLNSEGFWSRIEAFIERNSEARVSPSLCPNCSAKLYPDNFN